MSESTGAGRRAVPVWMFVVAVLVAVGVGVAVGRSSLLGARGHQVVTGEATLANRANWRTIFKAEDLDVPLAFDGRSACRCPTSRSRAPVG